MPNVIVPSDLDGDKVHAVPEDGKVTIGRSLDRDITILDRRASSLHAEITAHDDDFLLRDLNSTNGTYVNGRRIREHVLELGDEITCGQTLLVFSDLETYGKTAKIVGGPDMASAGQGPRAVDLGDVERRLFPGPSDDESGLTADRKLDILYRLSQDVTSIEDLDDLLERVADIICRAIPTDRVCILLSEPGAATHLVPRVIRKREGVREKDVGGVPVSMTLVNQVIESGQALFTQDALDDERFSGRESILQFDIRSAMAVPLRSKGRTIGVICLDKVEADSPFTDQDLQVLVLIANHAAQSISNARLYGQAITALAELRKAKEEILSWNLELERKVEDRTRELRERNEEITELSKQKDELLGMVAHDLRSPLTSIVGFADIALQRLGRREEVGDVAEDVDTIRSVAQEMTDLINDLLDAAKVEAGKVAVHRRPGSVEPILADVRRMMAPLASSRGLELGMECPDDLPDVPVDPHRLRQVITNLVHNAVKFSESGDQILLSGRAVDDGVEVAIQDTGPGISLEDQERIFQAWEQAENRSTAPGETGVGLGLSIARKLVRLHEGSIRIQSEPGLGTRFSFVIPFEPATRDEPAPAESAPAE